MDRVAEAIRTAAANYKPGSDTRININLTLDELLSEPAKRLLNLQDYVCFSLNDGSAVGWIARKEETGEIKIVVSQVPTY